MKRLAAFICLIAALTLADDRLQPRDLTPVTWLEAPRHAPVEIVREGKPVAVVYVADPEGRRDWLPKRKNESPSTLKRLVDELAEVVRLSTGATLVFVTNPPAATECAMVIGDCEETRRAGIDASTLPPEGFVVLTASNRVYLVGAGTNGTRDATAWAVADFLERFAGARWYWPVEAGGRCVPKNASLSIPPVHYRDQPVFRLRDYHPREGWKLPTPARSSDSKPLPFPPHAIPDGVQEVRMMPYLALVRAGCSWPYKIQCHEPQNLAKLPREFLEANPDMFALRKDGTRNVNLFCYSSPKALDYLLEGCERAWDKNGNCTWVTPTCVTVSPGDTIWECFCSDCMETQIRAGGTSIDGFSLIMGLFVKRMCEAVKDRWPDKKVIYMPYWNYQECPPSVDYPDNLVVMAAMTTFPMPLNAQPENFQDAVARLRAWQSKACVPVTVWDYCVAWTHGPYQYPHVVRDFQKSIQGLSAGTFINGWTMSDWTTTAPTLYVWMKALWNPDLDVDAVLDEMCRRLYGKAGATARDMIRLECVLWEEGDWRKQRVMLPGEWYLPKSLVPRVWPPEIVERLKTLRDQALVELADDPVARQRFLYWTWTFDAFIKEAERGNQ